MNPNDLIDWIGELEDYFELEDIKDPLRVSVRIFLIEKFTHSQGAQEKEQK